MRWPTSRSPSAAGRTSDDKVANHQPSCALQATSSGLREHARARDVVFWGVRAVLCAPRRSLANAPTGELPSPIPPSRLKMFTGLPGPSDRISIVTLTPVLPLHPFALAEPVGNTPWNAFNDDGGGFPTPTLLGRSTLRLIRHKDPPRTEGHLPDLGDAVPGPAHSAAPCMTP